MPAQIPPPSAIPDPFVSAQDISARGRLMKAAVDIFGRKGYAAASVREIVERAGVTKPVLYYHFGNKEGLMMAIIDGAARAMSAVVEACARQGGTTREQVFRLFSSVIAMVRAHTSELRVVHAVYYFAPELLPTFDARVFERIVLGELERVIQAGIESGEIRPVSPTAASIALGAILGASLDQELIHGEFPLKEDGLFQVLDLVFDGLCPTS